MSRLLNTLLGRAYSYDDLIKESAPFLNNPKLPEGLPEAMTLLDGKTRSFLEFTQLNYQEFLKDIASKPSKADQKAQLVFRLLSEQSWRAVERAAKDANHVESWAHLASGSEWFEPYPKTEWKRLLAARYLTALLCGSWLTVLGQSLYQLEPYIEAALDLHCNYDAEIKKLDVGIFETMFDRLAAYDDEEGLKVGKFKDAVINPLIKEQYVILDKLAADIKANTINVDYYKAQFARIDDIKQYIARTVTASAIPS